VAPVGIAEAPVRGRPGTAPPGVAELEGQYERRPTPDLGLSHSRPLVSGRKAVGGLAGIDPRRV
jgi:hypothetical protein